MYVGDLRQHTTIRIYFLQKQASCKQKNQVNGAVYILRCFFKVQFYAVDGRMAVNKIRFENQRAYPTAFNPTSVGGHIKLNIKQGKFYLT